MLVLLSWLNDFAAFGDASETNVERLASAMNATGLAVEAVEHHGAPIRGIVTARVLRTERHPQAERVHRVFVDTGDGTERHVWCGAFNMSAGDVVPLATLGTVMPDGRDIQKRKILGIASEGMLCSAHELGLGDDHSGILLLAPETTLGVPVFEALGIEEDVTFDLDITRNRPDCWGHLGVARDLAAWLDLDRVHVEPTIETADPPRSAPVAIVDGDRCGRFTSTVISGVHVAPSAAWMQRRLARAGMRPINNVVDVSNFVMLELNQPNHAYDLEALGGGGFRIRRARDGETMATLDGAERAFTSEDLLICDANDSPIGLGGIMGGLHSEITERTTVVALEIAWFQPDGIAQSAQRLGLRSEASARFDRGVDPYGIDRSIARFVELLRETCPNLTAHTGAVDARSPALPDAVRAVRVRTARVNAMLSTALNDGDIRRLLEPIGYGVGASVHPGVQAVSIPSWRPDSTAEIDVIEEIARHYGYANIAKTVPKSPEGGGLTGAQWRRRRVRDVLLGLGISEAMPDVFLSPGDAERAGLSHDVVSLTNPLVAEQSVLRGSLIPGLLKALAYNGSHRARGASLFEVGHRYLPRADVLPFEAEQLCITLAGREAPAAVAVWEELRAALGWTDVRLGVGDTAVAGLHPGRQSVVVTNDGEVIGALGEVDPEVLDAFGVDERVAVVDIDLGWLLAIEPVPVQFTPISRYPSSDIDLAFVAPDSVVAGELASTLRAAAGDLLASLELFDIYRGPGMAEGARSLAYRLRLQAPDRTLTDTDVTEVRARSIAAAHVLGATLRA